MAPVVGRCVQVVARVKFDRDAVERLVKRNAVERQAIEGDRPVGDAADGEPYLALVDDRRTGDDGEVAMPACELAKRITMARPTPWHDHRFDQFVLLARGRHEAGEEVGGGYAAWAIEPHTVPRLRVWA